MGDDDLGDLGGGDAFEGQDVDDGGELDHDGALVGLDGDGVPDAVHVAVDVDGNGLADVVVTGADLDGDGSLDVAAVAADLDGDGQVDVLATADASAAIWGDIDTDLSVDGSLLYDDVDYLHDTYEIESFPGYEEFYEVHGTPEFDLGLWDLQDDPMSCAVSTTSMMFSSLGLDVGEDVLAEFMQEEGTYHPIFGIDVYALDDSINRFAEATGLSIEAHEIVGFDTEQLQQMLDNGVRPLVAVDATELYGGDDSLLKELFGIPDSGHAVQVTAIEHTPEGSVVVVNDPGRMDGAGLRVPAERFLEAADDYDNTAVALTFA